MAFSTMFKLQKSLVTSYLPEKPLPPIIRTTIRKTCLYLPKLPDQTLILLHPLSSCNRALNPEGFTCCFINRFLSELPDSLSMPAKIHC